MATPIDELTIEIDAKANDANNAIDKLCKNIDKLTTSLSKIDGSKLNGLSSGISQLGTAMQSVNSKNINAVSRLSENITKLSTVDVSGLNKVASSLPSVASEFNKIGEINVDAQKFTELANGISRLGNKSATNAVTNIPKLSTAMKQLMKELSTAPKVSQNLIDMTNALAKLSRTGASSGRAAQSLSTAFTGVYKTSGFAVSGIKKINSHLVGLLRSIAPVVGFVKLLDFGKQAMEISSDLTEVQNVVDVTFGDFKQKIEDLASVSIPELGMSELSVKQIGSRFQAMGTAMGFSTEKMSDMSVELTRLTGDMASFYNVSQEDVGKALQSIFTGETEPMRRYGVDLTNATIQQYALSQGITKSVSSMTQLEKATLRYNYVMAQTGAAQGDFLRTQDTWANKIRILKENLKQLASIIGGTLINAFKPLVQALNNVMSHIISFAQTVSDALGKIFGWKFEVGGGGVTNDLETGAGAADDIASSMGSAADSAKKMHSYLSPLDELNINAPDTSSATGGGGLGNLGSGGASGSEWVKQDSIWKEFESEIDSLYELGEYIGKVLTDMMNSIDWEKVYEKARNFGTGLADFLNGLISPELFGAVGRTIAGALNTAIYAALAFGERFDWKDFGLSIATGINEFFATFDFADLANTIDVWVQGVWNTIKTAIENIKWEDVWNGVKEFLENIDIETVGIVIGALTIKKILGLHLASAALSMIGTSISRSIAQSIASKLGIELAANAGIRTALGAGLTKAFSGIGITFMAGLQGLFGNGAATSALAFINPIIVGITGIGSAIAGVTLAVTNFFSMWENGFSWLKEALMILGVAITAVGAVILGAPAVVAGVVAGIVASIGTIAIVIHDNWETISAWFEENIYPWFSAEKWYELGNGILEGLQLKLEEIKLWWQETAIFEWWENDVKPWFTVEKWSEMLNNIKTSFSTKWNETVTQWKINIAKWWNENVYPWFTKERWISLGENLKNGIYEGFKGIANKVVDVLNNVISSLESMVNTAISGINSMLEKLNGSVLGVFFNLDFKISNISFGRIPHFATGGIVKRPTFSLIGEDGPETVIPLSENSEWIRNVADQIENRSSNGSDELLREQNELLRQQNELLSYLADKEIIARIDPDRETITGLRNAERRLGYSFIG